MFRFLLIFKISLLVKTKILVLVDVRQSRSDTFPYRFHEFLVAFPGLLEFFEAFELFFHYRGLVIEV